MKNLERKKCRSDFSFEKTWRKNVDMNLVLKNMKKKYRSDFSFEKYGEKCRFDFFFFFIGNADLILVLKNHGEKNVDLIFLLKKMMKKCRSYFCFEKHGTFMMDSLANLKS